MSSAPLNRGDPAFLNGKRMESLWLLGGSREVGDGDLHRAALLKAPEALMPWPQARADPRRCAADGGELRQAAEVAATVVKGFPDWRPA